MTDVRFAPAAPLRGSLSAPPDKSISHRAALLGGFGEGTTRVGGFLDSADTRSSLGAVAALGARVSIGETGPGGGMDVEIEGFGLRGAGEPGAPIDVGNAGTLIRLLSGLLAGQEGRRFVLDGDESIRRRPMGRVVDPLREMGATIKAGEGGRPPVDISGTALTPIEYRMPVASAQVKSCVLLAGLFANGPTTVRQPAETRDHTERMLSASGVRVEVERSLALPTDPAPSRITVSPVERISLPGMSVPGDLSSAAFHLVAALLIRRSDVTVTGVGLNPTRVGLLGILNRMGAIVEVTETGYEAGEPVGSIRARASHLRGTRVEAAEVALTIDELPLVGLLGCFADGETVVRGAEELRHKESDRIAGVVDALHAIGGSAEALEDGFVITGTGGLRGGVVDSRGDHRLAMLGAVAGLASAEGVLVEGFDAAAISYPGFERDLRSL
jgi:3-phosphoshikimate 1-carboxyvinyltransferase